MGHEGVDICQKQEIPLVLLHGQKTLFSFHRLVNNGGLFPTVWTPLVSTMAADLYSPPSPLGDSLLGSPLCGDLIEDLPDISQSIGDDSLGFDFPEYQSSNSGSKSSITLGEYREQDHQVHRDHFNTVFCSVHQGCD